MKWESILIGSLVRVYVTIIETFFMKDRMKKKPVNLSHDFRVFKDGEWPLLYVFNFFFGSKYLFIFAVFLQLFEGLYESTFNVPSRRGYTIGDAGDASSPSGLSKKFCDP
jgi:hypothetical protein